MWAQNLSWTGIQARISKNVLQTWTSIYAKRGPKLTLKNLDSRILIYRSKCLKVQIDVNFLDRINGIDLHIYTFNF